jgi:NADPH:quinone reductase
MLAAWYERQGVAREVLQLGEQPDPEPGAGEVRVRVSYSGVNPGDTKKRRGWLGSTMPYPRISSHIVTAPGSSIPSARASIPPGSDVAYGFSVRSPTALSVQRPS